MGKLTHLEAFCSDVAKRGRVWTDGTEEFMRDGEELWFRGTISRTAPWTRAGRQVAAMEGTVTWADEPKTLTPQEALRSLADGKCLKLDSLVYRLGTKGTEYWSGGEMPRWWPNDLLIGFLLNRATIAPDPSQPAEPTKPPLKVGDRVKRGPDYPSGLPAHDHAGVVCKLHDDGSCLVSWYDGGVTYPCRYGLDGKYDIEKIEAEPETPAPSFKAGDRVRVVRNSFGACDNTVGALGTVLRFNSTSDIDVRSDLDGISWCFDETDLVLIEAEPQVEFPLTFAEAMWAMECGSHVSSERWPGNVYHKDYSFLAFDTDEVKSSWRIVEPATGGEG